MKRDVKDFLEQAVLCACVIGVIFHLNSKLGQKSSQQTLPQKQKTEQVDSVHVDTMQNIQQTRVMSENIKSR